jgi:hypothetical protein
VRHGGELSVEYCTNSQKITVLQRGYIMNNLTYKVTYPDGDVEYWAGESNSTIADEIIRLEKLYDNEIVFEIVEKNNMLMN